jgi:hypothetical protein
MVKEKTCCCGLVEIKSGAAILTIILLILNVIALAVAIIFARYVLIAAVASAVNVAFLVLGLISVLKESRVGTLVYGVFLTILFLGSVVFFIVGIISFIIPYGRQYCNRVYIDPFARRQCYQAYDLTLATYCSVGIFVILFDFLCVYVVLSYASWLKKRNSEGFEDVEDTFEPYQRHNNMQSIYFEPTSSYKKF